MKKGQSTNAILGIVVGVIVAAIMATVLWGVINPMTSLPNAVVNETINFAANNTWYNFGVYPENVLTVTSVSNATMAATTATYNFDEPNNRIKLNGTYVAGSYHVSYTWRYNTYLTDSTNRSVMGYVFTFFIIGILIVAGAYMWTLRM